AEPTARDLVEMWVDRTGAKTKKVAQGITRLAQDLLDALVNGEGIYDLRYGYWHGGQAMNSKGVRIAAVLDSDLTAPQDRDRVKAAAALFGNILWDDDFLPFFVAHGLNLGTANMPVQYQSYRNFYALLLAGHPTMKARARLAERQTLRTLRHIV